MFTKPVRCHMCATVSLEQDACELIGLRASEKRNKQTQIEREVKDGERAREGEKRKGKGKRIIFHCLLKV